MDNIQLTETQSTQGNNPLKEVLLTEVPVNNENDALNLLIGFLAHAHKKGVFTIAESAKIWECIKVFQKPLPKENK
jgi:hypothetical protein